jgi:uncharacterized protein (UPF0335 family)
MLDFDLAELYETPTKALKQAVKRNIKRFPPDFMFTLTKVEWKELVTNCDHIPETMKHSYIPPFAFTEHGAVMLSSVLRSDIAIHTSVLIVRAFVALRQLIANPPESRIERLENQMKELKAYIEDVLDNHHGPPALRKKKQILSMSQTGQSAETLGDIFMVFIWHAAKIHAYATYNKSNLH